MRSRVTLGATVAMLVVLVLFALLLVTQQRRALTEALDEALDAEADAIEAAIAADALDAELDPFIDDDATGRVIDANGTVVARTTTDEDDEEEEEDEAMRVLRERTGDLTIVLAAPIEGIDDSVDALARSLAFAVPMATAILASLVWVLVGRTLRPVEAIRAEVATIGGDELHRRVPVPPADDEIGRLARTMNEMLERVESSTRRQSQFVADASHELRTPLARMRAELEVDLAHPSTADVTATHHSLLEEVEGLQHLVDALLALARADGGAARTHDEVDLASLVRADDVIRVDATPSLVRGDRHELARAVGNLIDNARRHASSWVDVEISEGTVTVSDDGPGVPDDQRERIFERFTQADESRHATGAGLGLPIAREIAERHGGTLELVGANRFVLRLPTVAP